MTVRRKGRTGLGSGCLFLSRAAVDRATVRPSDCLTFSSRESGETGRRTRLRIWRRKAWGFESPLSHRCNRVLSVELPAHDARAPTPRQGHGTSWGCDGKGGGPAGRSKVNGKPVSRKSKG